MTDDVLYGDMPDGILTETHITIPGLPAPMPRDHEAWEAWCVEMLKHRQKVIDTCARNADARRIQTALCKQPYGLGTAYFAITFGWIYEPRADDDSTMVPFFLFPRQVELLIAMDAAMRRPKGPLASVAIPKARGVGATWCDAIDHIWRWLFTRSFQGRLVSRTEKMVDDRGNSDSWMWKFDYVLDRLPFWLLPEGYASNSIHRTHLAIRNPVTGSAIIGEATTKGVGVGGRATKYSLDEFARLADGASIWGQLSETTNHRVAISTHNIEVSTDFWDMVHGINGWEGSQPIIFEMPWDCVPGRDQAWLEETRRTMRHDMFQREVMMNPWAGLSGWVYPEARKKTPAGFTYRDTEGLVITGLDDGYDDEFAIVWTQRERNSNRLIVLDGYSNSHQTIAFYGNLLKGELPGRYEYDMEARRIARWIMEYRLWRGLFVGDRHGANTEITSGTSAWSKLYNDFGITVLPNPPSMNTYKDRRDALSQILPDIEFADTPGALRVLEAIQNNKFPQRRNSSQPVNEVQRPVHDQTSHFTTALEYVAAYIVHSTGGALQPRGEPSSARRSFLAPRLPGMAGRRRAPERVQNQWLTE